MSAIISSYLWNFGDGQTSTLKNPVHVYSQAGVYVWTLTCIDHDGRTLTDTGTVYVYDSDFASGLHVPFTSVCYRTAVKPMQGCGISKYTGTDWVFPTSYYGACKGFTKSGDTISLVCNNRNGRFYRIGIPELWTDKEGDYSGTEIVSKIRLKSRIATAGEFHEIEHVESHIHLRPWKEENRNQVGYTSDGFKLGHSVDLAFYENGEPSTPSTKLEDVSRYGDYVSRKRVEARQIQEEYTFSTAGWRAVKTQEMYMPINKASGPAFDYPSEQEWQDEFRGALLWLSRDRLRPTTNRATGSVMTGDYDQLTTGPDNQQKSAMAMALTHSLSSTLGNVSGNFIVSMWLGSMATFPGTVFQCAAGAGLLLIKITEAAGVRSIVFDDGVNGWSRELSWTGGWVHIAVVRDGTLLRIYEDGVEIFSNTMVDSSIIYGGATIVSNAIIASIFDIRFIERAISSNAIYYYYDQVVSNGKQCPFLPIVR